MIIIKTLIPPMSFCAIVVGPNFKTARNKFLKNQANVKEETNNDHNSNFNISYF